ncbi:unnamed protein product, partial [Clonostachys rosea f. rosea IK726]
MDTPTIARIPIASVASGSIFSSSPPSTSKSCSQIIPRQPKYFPRDGDALALRFLGHFFNCTLGDIVHTAGPHDFWRRTLPTLAQSEPLIRHAITALGTTHWLFMGREFATPSQIAASEAVLNQQYNQAITHLIPLMSYHPDSNPYIPLILICCLLFVYIECLRESRTEAFRHLVSGSRLLASLMDVSPISSPPGKSLREIAAMFRWIDSDVTPFAYDRLLSNLASFANPAAGGTEAESGPFASLSEVEDELTEIDMEVYDNKWSAHGGGKWADLPLEHREVKRASWETVKNRFLVWEGRFEKTLKVLGLENDDSYEVLNLRFQRHMWRLMMNNNEQLWDEDPKMKPEDENARLHGTFQVYPRADCGIRVMCGHGDSAASDRAAADTAEEGDCVGQ